VKREVVTHHVFTFHVCLGTQIKKLKNDLRRSALRSICAICVPIFIGIGAGSPAGGLILIFSSFLID